MTIMSRKLSRMRVGATAAGLVAIVVAGLLTSATTRATPQFAKDTGKSCADCHVDPKGGMNLTTLGAAFKANGNKLPAGG